jgi:hypothetical protein
MTSRFFADIVHLQSATPKNQSLPAHSLSNLPKHKPTIPIPNIHPIPLLVHFRVLVMDLCFHIGVAAIVANLQETRILSWVLLAEFR